MARYKITELEFKANAPITLYEGLKYHVAWAKFEEWRAYRCAELDRDESDIEIQEGEELNAYYEGEELAAYYEGEQCWIKLEAE